MVKDMNLKELLNVSEFVREPALEFMKQIKACPDNKIILTGGRGVGKSSVLYNFENTGIGNLNQLIYTRFDGNNLISDVASKSFDDNFFSHYYELVLSLKILDYIKKYYGLTYEKYFKDYGILLNNIAEKTNLYLRDIRNKKVVFTSYLKPTELTSSLLERLKNCLGLENIFLAIDRFDWINGDRELIQNILSNFHHLQNHCFQYATMFHLS